MAVQSSFGSFNPDVKDTAPGNYLKLFDSISSFEQPSPLGVALKGAATLMDKGLEAANALVLNEGRNQVEKRIEPKIEEYTTALEDVRDRISAATKPTATNTAGTDTMPGSEGGVPAGTGVAMQDDFPGDVLGARAAARPAAIDDTERRIDNLKAAKAQGKLPTSYFDGAIADEAKNIRNNFPIGYRPEIDAMISAKMHTVQANPYIQSLLHDINASLTAKNAENNKVSSFLLNHVKYDGVEQIYTAHSNGQIDNNEAVRRASIPIQAEQRITEAHNRLNLNAAYLKQNKDFTLQTAQGVVNDIIVQKNSVLSSASGVDQQLAKIIINGNRGDYDAMDTQTKITLARRAEALRVEAEEKARVELTRINDKGDSFAGILGPDETNKLIKFAGSQFAEYSSALYSGKLDLAASRMQTIEAMKQDATYKGIISNPQIVNSLALIDYAKKNGLPDAQLQVLSENLMMSTNDFRKGFDEVVKNQKLNLLTPSEQMSGIQKYYTTWKDTLEDMKSRTNSVGQVFDLPDHINEVTKMIDGQGKQASLINPQTPQDSKNTIAWNFFGPGNKNAFQYFKENMFDNKGNLIPGAEALFDRFSKPDIVKEILKMPSGHQKAYLDFMTTTAHEDILRRDLPKLKETLNSPNSVYKLGWNTETKNLVLEQNPNLRTSGARGELEQPAVVTGVVLEQARKLNQTVFSINQTLTGLKNIAETTGLKNEAVDAYVLGPIRQSLGDISDVPGVPENLAAIIKNAYAKKRFEEESGALSEKDRQKNYQARPRRGQ